MINVTTSFVLDIVIFSIVDEMLKYDLFLFIIIEIEFID
jgi:hypothetical protein